MAEAEAMTGSWTPAMELDELWEGEMTGVTVAGTSVLLVNVDGDVRAYRNRCPHQEWALDEGDFDGEIITCSRHLWEFEACSGTGRNPATASLTSFPCRVDDAGMIQVDVGSPP
jgi:toluene monooxygenase system ferredoxin subunit